MPQLQWLGTLGAQDKSGVDKLESGIALAMNMAMKGKEMGMQKKVSEANIANAQSETDIKRTQLEREYAKVDFDKKRDAYDSMVKLLPNLPPEKQVEVTSSPEWVALESSIGVPSIKGSTLNPEQPKPGWSNISNTEAVRANLIRKRVGPKRDMYGMSEPKELATAQDAVDYITEEGLDPAQFARELAGFGEVSEGGGERKGKPKLAGKVSVVEERKAPNGDILQKMSDGRIVYKSTGQEVR
jgi:hypothetical protein